MRICVIGDFCQDVYHIGSVTRRSRESLGAHIVDVAKTLRFDGMAANVDANLRNLGHTVFPVFSTARTVLTRVLTDDGQHIVRFDVEHPVAPISYETLDEIPWSKFDAVSITDQGRGFIDEAAIKLCASRHPRVFLDTRKVLASWAWQVFCAKFNQFEFAHQTSTFACHTVVTHGARGAQIIDGELYLTPGVTHPTSVCGAGDAFMAALVHGFLETGGDLGRAVAQANQLTASALSCQGTIRL